MDTRTYFTVCAGLIAGLYLMAFIADPALFIIYLCLGGITGAVLSFFFVTEIVRTFLPSNLRNLSRHHKLTYRMILLACLILFFTWGTIYESIRTIMLPDSVPDSTPEQLAALPYATWVPTKGKATGVSLYDPIRASPGVNLYAPRNITKAFLIEMNGNTLHTWSAKTESGNSWQHVELAANGDLLCIAKDEYLTRLDWNSKTKWRIKGRFHHDVRIASNSDIYALIRKDRIVFLRGFPLPIVEDRLLILSADGKIKTDYGLFESFSAHVSANKAVEIYKSILHPNKLLIFLWNAMKNVRDRDSILFEEDSSSDIFHANSVMLLSKNNFLVSLLRLNLVSIYHAKSGRSLWEWGPGNLDHVHHPTLLENGNVLMFENGYNRGYSRVIEVNPATDQIVWEYKSKPENEFYSISRGGAERLPNENTLVTESDRGHVFEITKNGKIVWEFYTPQVSGNERAAVYRMKRFSDAKEYPCLTKIFHRSQLEY